MFRQPCRVWIRFVGISAGALSILTFGCSADQSPPDTRGVLDLFVSGPLDVSLDGLVYIISGADAGVVAGALPPNHPVTKLMLPPAQNYSVAVTGLGKPPGATDTENVACEGSQDFEIRELRTTEVDLNIGCETVGPTPKPVTQDTSCSVASMLVAPRIQELGATISMSADPFPEHASLTWTTPNNGVGQIVSVGQDKATEYSFECVKNGFTEIVAEVTDGVCKAQASSAVVCVTDETAIDLPE